MLPEESVAVAVTYWPAGRAAVAKVKEALPEESVAAVAEPRYACAWPEPAGPGEGLE